NKIKKLTGKFLHRNWVTVPHVTQFADADITEMEAYRQANKKAAAEQGYKLTPIVFVIKAVVAALKEFADFNASLDAKGENLIVKQYYNIGVAIDTPNGLVVPVLRDADKKSIEDLARELVAISMKARDKGLSPKDMQGGNFTISSLGGIGGTAFTPIVNVPDVAILGLSKSSIKPVYQDDKFVPRLMLPLSLSYDHRVIDGAEGARFITYLSQCLNDVDALIQ
ncbi:MAG: 2-oxo acid dehydrogenase subunit E2, partial [Alcanivoracaceae bacterium]|nr:2-oxo acid dehydrogenase subunit E2 [Alcanivoracaceae bacterium]